MPLHDVSSPGWIPGIELDYVQITSNVVITANSDATAQAVIDGNPVLFDGSLRVKIEFFCLAAGIAAANEMLFNPYDGSTDLGRIAATTNQTGSSGDMAVACVPALIVPSAGLHTFHIKAWRVVNSGTMTVFAGAGGVGTNRPAWYRITVA